MSFQVSVSTKKGILVVIKNAFLFYSFGFLKRLQTNTFQLIFMGYDKKVEALLLDKRQLRTELIKTDQ